MVVQPVDQEIIDSLGSFHKQLFSGLRGDQTALENFVLAWTSFESTLLTASESLREDTLQKVYSFSSMVASVIEGVTAAETRCSELYEEVSSFLDGVVPTLPTDTLVTPQMTSPLPAYIRLASKWLVSNIHNPYPSQEARNSIAQQTNSSRKDVDNWFLDARKRIGWNDMRRKRFDNRRVDIVNAATRFFRNTDPSRPLPPVVESEFIGVQLRAKDLYSDKFEESPLAAELDKAIVDMTPDRKAMAGGSRKRTSSASKAARHYPTPQPSPTGSSSLLTPSPTPSFLELPSTTSKRGASVLSEYDECDGRPSKRRRPSTGARNASPSLEIQRPMNVVSSGVSLPSPVSSTSDESDLQPLPQYADSIAPSAVKRKRRLSDPDSLPNPKRPQHSPASSRPQAVSDPLPVAQYTATEALQWDQLIDFTQMPPPVSTLTADITGPVEVSVFQFPESWGLPGFGAESFAQDLAASSSNLLDVGVNGGSSTQPTNLMPDDSLMFDWAAYGTYPPIQQPSAEQLLDLPNVSYDFSSLADQWTTPITLPANDGCLPCLTMPSQLAPEPAANIVQEPTVTISKSELEAKERKLRALQAQIAALTAEIAATS